MISANCQYRPAMRAAPAYDEIILERPELFASLMKDIQSNLSAAVSLIRSLRESGAVERGVLDPHAFEVLISTMSKFRNSESVQSGVLLMRLCSSHQLTDP